MQKTLRDSREKRKIVKEAKRPQWNILHVKNKVKKGNQRTVRFNNFKNISTLGVSLSVNFM